MALQKMKFKMNIKELSFEYEGDFEQGQKLQTGITSALSAIGNLQNGVMGLPPVKPADARVVEILSPVRTRRRRRRGEPSGTDGNGFEAGTTGEAVVGEKNASRRATGSSPIQLLKELKKSGFFEGGKTTSEIVAHVNAKGHTKLTNSSFSAQLLSLSKKDILERKQDEGGGWTYFPGPNDE